MVIFQILTLQVFIYTIIADAFEKGICHLITILLYDWYVCSACWIWTIRSDQVIKEILSERITSISVPKHQRNPLDDAAIQYLLNVSMITLWTTYKKILKILQTFIWLSNEILTERISVSNWKDKCFKTSKKPFQWCSYSILTILLHEYKMNHIQEDIEDFRNLYMTLIYK